MRTYNGPSELWGNVYAVLRVETRDRGPVYMRAGGTQYCNSERAVVEVETEKFLALWQRSPRDNTAGQVSWREDRKYPQAEKGFSYGADNPVPLAQPHLCTYAENIPIYSRWLGLIKRLEGYEEKPVEYISFTDGVTRTLWLLENGVKVFPIECRVSQAGDLQRAVGVASGSYMTVDQLLRV